MCHLNSSAYHHYSFFVLVSIGTQAAAQSYRWTVPNGAVVLCHTPPSWKPYELVIFPSEEMFVLEEASQGTVTGLLETKERATPQARVVDRALLLQLVE